MNRGQPDKGGSSIKQSLARLEVTPSFLTNMLITCFPRHKVNLVKFLS